MRCCGGGGKGRGICGAGRFRGAGAARLRRYGVRVFAIGVTASVAEPYLVMPRESGHPVFQRRGLISNGAAYWILRLRGPGQLLSWVALPSPEKLLDYGELQPDISRAAVVSLAA